MLVKELIKGLEKRDIPSKDVLVRVYTEKFLEAGAKILDTYKELEKLESECKEKGLLYSYVRIDKSLSTIRDNVYSNYTYEAEKNGLKIDFNAFYSNWNYEGDIYKKQCKMDSIVNSSMDRFIEYSLSETDRQIGYILKNIQIGVKQIKVNGSFWDKNWNKIDKTEIKDFMSKLLKLNGIKFDYTKIEITDNTIKFNETITEYTVQKNGKMILIIK